jgi:two pore calcium channel protein 3
MIPAIENSAYYFIYFLVYALLYTLLFIPIPVALVFDGYRDNRCKLVIMDRLKQREALLACFIALDYEK